MTATTDPAAQGSGDYRTTTVFESSPDAVFDALTSVDALARWWWAPGVTGSAAPGGELALTFAGLETRIRVEETSRPAWVRWTVLVSEPLPDWVGTTITFDIAPTGEGAVLYFTHHGLTPQLECFASCYAGWTQYLASLVDYVDHDGGNPFGSGSDERADALRARQAPAAS
jgi:uncharacterized protein YndB with AHSA1/START domain